jgi:N-acyl homoserine lactone hydrolase
MAPHWKCGSGQPVAGSNPALSAIDLPVVIVDVVPLVLGEFRFAVDEPHAGEAGVVVAYAVRHRAGVLLFDTGFGFGNDELDAYYRIEARRLPDVLTESRIAIEDVTAVVNCHLHVDHAGQNSLFPGVPIYVQPAEWEIAHTTEHTILDWIDFPGADYRPIAGDHEPVDGIRVLATPGHTIGHQSLVVATARGDVVLAGQALYTPGEWAGDPEAREGRSRAPDRAAYDRSVERLKALDPVEVAFGHDRQVWTGARSAGL